MTIWILILGTMALSLFAVARVKSVYHRYNRGTVLSGATGAEAAALILRQAGIQDVEIAVHDQMLGDHYDPLHKRLVLSSQNYYGATPAALGVAAHEAGHALQHAHAYKPLHWRMAAVGVTTYANQVVMWLPVFGIFTGLIQPMVALWVLALAWGVIMLFNLITLPVEFDASRRAKIVLRNLNLIEPGSEAVAVSRVLNAAAWTYVAAFITSLVYFLWHLLPLLTGRDRD
ncbi:MAG: zinc metallopeptidase [Verrucomicrobia bacterium]|nr:zinc metallopeptidase [Verrucomicrobiota bacterium]